MENAKAGFDICVHLDSKQNISDTITDKTILTNNRAELWAIVKTIEFEIAKKKKNLVIVTDSKYVVEAVNKHLLKWRENNWKTYNKKSVTNSDLIKKIDELRDQINKEKDGKL